ncbi:CMGC/CDK protein kinase Csk1 [Schizosaccharomyces japonicus yFS275]|uniref:CMGC/CDK protein kinase Csk1 n=1 Tax=Schizosaccharomyces japonicus (strain yFS275 / FY16936) TaxID=402676 RepID=B6JX72_SCHJY|nr:CMGC/CDK protein kinase Csk1 [Schizosaccharomyces japonicus yFS275]EEB05973.2 CMGC/CDK protein kinase Csk1 [Schizosaccharomyces japonicus yFS275]
MSNVEWRNELLENAEYLCSGTASEVYTSTAKKGTKGSTRVYVVKVQDLSGKRPPHDAKRGFKILSELRHPNIDVIEDAFMDKFGSLCIVSAYKRFTLSSCQSQLSYEAKLKVSMDIASALDYLYENEIIHRDIHPNNVLLDSLDGPAILTDFSTAWSYNCKGQEKQGLITQIGTGHYKPVETLFGYQYYYCEVDWWAFGILVAELFSQTDLFDDGSREGWPSELKLINSIFKTLGTPNPNIWPALATFPDWNKFVFTKYHGKHWEDILPNVSEDIQLLVSTMVKYTGRGIPSSVREHLEQLLIEHKKTVK